MAYMNKEKKAKIAAKLKTVVPKGWKYSLRVDNYSSIVMTIRSAPVNLVKIMAGGSEYVKADATYLDVNPYHWEKHAKSGDVEPPADVIEAFEKIFEALNTDNFDNSDPMTDYFHVGHYVNLTLGRWDKPFEVK